MTSRSNSVSQIEDLEFLKRNGACRSVDPNIFFPIGTSGAALIQIEAAKAICHTCLHREMCLDWALATHQDHGIWGGATEEERRRINRRRAQARRAAS